MRCWRLRPFCITLAITPTRTKTPTPTATSTGTTTNTPTATATVGAGGPIAAVALSQPICLLAATVIGGGIAFECASPDPTNLGAGTNLANLADRLTGGPPGSGVPPSAADFARIDLDANQRHEKGR